jgi:putative transposase
MIDRGHDLPLARQAELLRLSRSTLYYEPRPVPVAELAIMRRIDELHLDYPFAGSRMLRDLLPGEGIAIGRELVATMMRRMRIEALYRRPNTSKPADGHKIYPYLLRGLAVERPNQVWAMDITYIPMARGFVYLAAVVDWFSRRVLAWRLSITLEVDFCLEAVEEALARHGRPEIFNTDSKSDGVGSFSMISSYQAANCPRVAGTARCPSRPDPNTDRPGFVSFPGSVGWLSHRAVRFCLADAGDPRRA